MGAQGLAEDWNAKRQGPVLEEKITWAIQAGMKTREDLASEYKSLVTRVKTAVKAHEPQDEEYQKRMMA